MDSHRSDIQDPELREAVSKGFKRNLVEISNNEMDLENTIERASGCPGLDPEGKVRIRTDEERMNSIASHFHELDVLNQREEGATSGPSQPDDDFPEEHQEDNEEWEEEYRSDNVESEGFEVPDREMPTTNKCNFTFHGNPPKSLFMYMSYLEQFGVGISYNWDDDGVTSEDDMKTFSKFLMRNNIVKFHSYFSYIMKQDKWDNKTRCDLLDIQSALNAEFGNPLKCEEPKYRPKKVKNKEPTPETTENPPTSASREQPAPKLTTT